MKPFLTIVKSDYLQRTRSYAFLITLCASLAIGYTFVPEPNANYSTIRIADHVGYYNSAWFGYVTAIMTSIFLSLIGFYLVNSGIKKDIETRVGQIVASTPISNFKYLFSKTLSNFILLLTIVAMVFIMSILLFTLYNDGYSFELFQFIKPYVLITIPTMFFISVLAVVFEVFFGKYSVIQNIGFFFLFSILMVFTPKTEAQYSLDLFGSKIVIHKLEETVRDITNSDKITDLSIGYVVPDDMKETKKFEFNGIDFPLSFIISRFIWILFGIVIIAIISTFFHRFDRKRQVSVKRFVTVTEKKHSIKEVILSSLPKAQVNYSIFPLLKTEFLMLFRKGKKWLWIINGIGMVLLAILPIQVSHQIVLPILWFLQVSRLSDLTTKETTHNAHYFAFTAFKPISRLFTSQLVASVVLMVLLASPLLIRLGLSINFIGVFAVIFGGILMVMLAALLGILSKGKKLFEVLFFMITYVNINGIPFVDYFGGFEHHQFYLIQLLLFILFLGIMSTLMRKLQLEK
jgi:hypothetical protein